MSHSTNADDMQSSMDFLTMREASAFTGLSISSLYKLTMRRQIPYTKPGGKVNYIKKRDLVEYLERNPQKSLKQIKEDLEQELVSRCNKK